MSAVRPWKEIPGDERSSHHFRVALGLADFHDASGRLKYRDIGLSLFDNASQISLQWIGLPNRPSRNTTATARIPCTASSS